MTNKLIALVVALEFLLAVASWLFSALGYPVSNLLSDEGLRWSLRYGFSALPVEYLATLIMACIAVGVLPKWQDKAALRKMTVWLALLWIVTLAFAAWPSSPLRGVSGGLYPSPFVSALPTLVCLSVIVVCVAMNIRSAGDMLVYGIRKYAVIIFFYLLLSFLLSEIRYVWQ